MKKVLSFLLLLVYFTVSTGFVVSLHYCMDRFDSAQLGHSQSSKCSKCGMHKSEGCCHDEVKVVKLQLAHISAGAQIFLMEAPACPVVQLSPMLQPFLGERSFSETSTHGPPLGRPPAYIMNQVFRI